MLGARTWILDQLDAERSRWMLWLPVAMGLGIAVYFELPSEPALWLGPALAAGALVLVFLARSGSLARALALGAVAAALGLGLVAWRTASLAAPTLSRPLFSINVEGRIADIQRLPESVRVVLEAVRLKGNGVPPIEMTPARVRVSLSKGAPPIHVGDELTFHHRILDVQDKKDGAMTLIVQEIRVENGEGYHVADLHQTTVVRN